VCWRCLRAYSVMPTQARLKNGPAQDQAFRYPRFVRKSGPSGPFILVDGLEKKRFSHPPDCVHGRATEQRLRHALGWCAVQLHCNVYDTHCGGGSETPLRLRWQHSAPSSEVHPLRPPLASFPHVSSALSHQCAMLLRLGICALCLHRAWSVGDDEKHPILSTVVLISVLVCPLHVELP
jgi:hypothetical protein